MESDRIRILLVEDNAGDVYLFRRALQTAGLDFELTVIDDGADAVAFVKGLAGQDRKVPQLAVLDLNLPRVDGIEVLRSIRSHPEFRDVPVVITSSSPSFSQRAEAERLHFNRYVQKPSDLNEFLKIGLVLKEVLAEGMRAGQ